MRLYEYGWRMVVYEHGTGRKILADPLSADLYYTWLRTRKKTQNSISIYYHGKYIKSCYYWEHNSLEKNFYKLMASLKDLVK